MSETDFTDFPWKEAQQLVDAWMEGKHERPLNGGDVSDLETRIRSALATAEQETRAEAVREIVAWLRERKPAFEHEEGAAEALEWAANCIDARTFEKADAIERDFLKPEGDR